jgi:hypothetical protein
MSVHHSLVLAMMWTMWTFQKFFDLNLMRNIVQEDKKLVQQQVNKSDALFTFCLKIRNREDSMADEAYTVLALCMLLEISETHTKILLQQELPDVHFFLSCNSSA